VLFRLPRGFYNDVRAHIYQQSTVPKPEREHLLPSSGFLIAIWFLEVVKSQAVHLIGFDHFSKVRSGAHHYWDHRDFAKPKEHDGAAEAEWLVGQYPGRVLYLAK
jgi:hypothetical protein